MTSASPRNWLRVGLSAGVCIASTLAGGLAGVLATALYHWEPDQQAIATGGCLGSAAGFIVGVLWCWAMWKWTVRFAGNVEVRALLRVRGLLAGLVAGAVAAIGLHLGLMAATHEWLWPMLLGGQAFGIPVGVLVGVLGGSAWAASVTNRTEETS